MPARGRKACRPRSMHGMCLHASWKCPISNHSGGCARVGCIPGLKIDAIKRDEDDNRVLECAVAGRADLIVSGDRDLTELKSFRGIGIVRPADFDRIIQEKPVPPRE